MNGNPSPRKGRPAVPAAMLVLAGAALAGCAPTYGTGTHADAQLVTDLAGLATLTPKRAPAIDYKARPDLVEPANTEVLPPPQQDVASASNPDWPESPEQRRARIRAEATAHQDDPSYRPEVASSAADTTGGTSTALRTAGDHTIIDPLPANTPAKRADFQRRIAENNQGDPNVRKYLSEPPLAYRDPAATAPTDQLGEDEWKKERDAKRAARKASGKHSWRDLVPWL